MQKNENRPGYKKTKVGWIPEEWNIKTLENVATYTNGKAHEGSINPDGKYVVVNSKFISTDGLVRKYSDDCFLPAKQGDVLMVMSDVPNGRAIARCFLVDKDDFYTVNQRICLLHPTQINEILLYYRLNRHPYYLSFDDGAKQTNLRKDDVISCPLAIPSPSEQEAIAGVLECWDRGIRNLELKIRKKRNIKKGLMQKLLSGQQRLPGFSKDWETKKIGDVLSIGNGKDYKHLAKGNIPVFGTGGLMTYVNEKLHSGETVFIGRKGTINKPFYFNGDFWTVDTLFYTYNFKSSSPRFIHSVFLQINWKQHNEASGVPSLSKANISNIQIELPPLEEQQAIAEVLSAADGEIEALERKLALWQGQKKYLLNNLVTGTIRLPQFRK